MPAKVNRGKTVRNSNCNGIPITDDVRIRRRLCNEYTMAHPVPSHNDIGKNVIVNIGALGPSIPEAGYMRYAKESISKDTIRYAGIISRVTGNLVFIDRVYRVAEGETWDKISEDGIKFRLKQCCEPLGSFRCGYARYVITPALYTKHLVKSAGGGGKTIKK